jgi:transposase
MEQYVGLDVSLEETSICVLDQSGAVVFEGDVASNPQVIAKLLRRRAPQAIRIAFETGSLSNWLWHELKALEFPVVCLDARHAKAALSMRMNKSDRNDARGLAEMARMGWYREAKVKSIESRHVRAMLAARAKLVDLRRDLENQMRGLLKSLGIILGKAGSKALPRKILDALQKAPHLRPLIEPLMLAHSNLISQVIKYDDQLKAMARSNQTVRRLMTVPGVGPVTALAFASTVDDPQRFERASDVGAYLGLTPRRYQSGELDRTGRISKRGDRLTRCYLFEAANVLLRVVRRGSPLKSWGLKLAKRIGPKKAKVAVARKLATVLHCLWTDGTQLDWGKAAA